MTAAASAPVASLSRRGDDLLVRPLVGSLPEVKTLGATWDRGSGAWKLPAARMHLRSVEDLLGDVDLRPLDNGSPFANDSGAGRPRVVDERLYDWQRPRAQRLVDARRGLLLCASPGLGKTAMAIVAADLAVPDDQVVVVCPSKLTRTWQRQITLWGVGDTSTAIVSGKPDWDVVSAARWVVISWELFSIHQDWFLGKWPLWVLDESVKAKSRRSTLSMAMRGGTRRKKRADGTVDVKRWENLRKGIERVWLLSGSPTTRHADDLWAQLNMIWPRAFPSYWRFAERYCVVEETVWAKTVIRTRRGRDVAADNSDFIEVVSQEDVVDLPEYLFEAVDVDLLPRQARAYEEMERQFIATLASGDVRVAQNRMDQLGNLQRIISWWDGESAKHDALVANVESGDYEGPHLVWTHWRDGADALTERLHKAGVGVAHVKGGMSESRVDGIVEDYVAGKTDVLVLSVGVGKYGFTFTNTKTIHWVDRSFNADDYLQGLRRVRRLGLTHRPVSIAYRAPGTVEDLVDLNLEGKVDGIARVTNASLRELMMGIGRSSDGRRH